MQSQCIAQWHSAACQTQTPEFDFPVPKIQNASINTTTLMDVYKTKKNISYAMKRLKLSVNDI